MFSYSDLAGTSVEELAQAWNRCWKGYYYETHYSVEQMKAWIDKCQIDLAHSMALRCFNDIIGFSLLAVERDLGWIAGTCIQPEYRGQQLFYPILIDQLARAKELNLKSIQLEVLSQNHALKTYEKVGFQKKRELYIYRYPEGTSWTLANPGRGYSLREAKLADYFQARKEAGFHPPWQRREEFLKGYTSLRAWLNHQGNFGVLMSEDSSFLLDAWTTGWEQIEKFMSSILILTQSSFVLTNQPKDLLTAYLSRSGIQPSDIQYEMSYNMHR